MKIPASEIKRNDILLIDSQVATCLNVWHTKDSVNAELSIQTKIDTEGFIDYVKKQDPLLASMIQKGNICCNNVIKRELERDKVVIRMCGIEVVNG